MDNFLKLVSAEVNNFQALEHVKVDVDGKSIAIIGKNGGGKSSFLRAIQSALDPSYQPKYAIKDGEERADVTVKLEGEENGEDVYYEYSIMFTPKDKKGKVFVKRNGEEKIDSKDIQADIIGNISFEIDEFIRLGQTATGKISKDGIKKQIEVMRGFLSDEENKTLNYLDVEIEKLLEDRKDNKKEVKRLENLVAEKKLTEEEMEKYSVDRLKEKEEINSKLTNLGESIKQWNRIDQGVTEMTKRKAEILLETKSEERAKVVLKSAKEFHLEIDKVEPESMIFKDAKDIISKLDNIKVYISHCEDLNKELEEIETKLLKGKNWLEANPEPEVGAINDQLKEINDHQEMVEHVKKINDLWKEANELKETVEQQSKDLESKRNEKKELFANSGLPIKNLEFDEEDGILYKGLPFNQDHHPTSTILGVGVKMAMAMNPNLKCIFIKDGSMFDKKTFANVLKFIESNGYSLIIEMVDWSGEKEVEVTFAETIIK